MFLKHGYPGSNQVKLGRGSPDGDYYPPPQLLYSLMISFSSKKNAKVNFFQSRLKLEVKVTGPKILVWTER